MVGVVGLCIGVQAQDQIFKKNGEVLSVQIDSVRNSGIYFTYENGVSRVLDTYEVSAVKFALGENLPIAGNYARRNLANAYRYQNFPSQHKVGFLFDILHQTFMLNYEYFADQKLANAISVQVGGGVSSRPELTLPIFPKNNFITQVEYHYYPSLHRNVRYFFGPYLNFNVGRDYSEGDSRRQFKEYQSLGVGIINGLQVKLGSLTWNTKFGFGFDTYTIGTFYLQTGFTYYIPKK